VLTDACYTKLRCINSGVTGQKPIKFTKGVDGSLPLLMRQSAFQSCNIFQMPAQQMNMNRPILAQDRYKDTQMSHIISGITKSNITRFFTQRSQITEAVKCVHLDSDILNLSGMPVLRMKVVSISVRFLSIKLTGYHSNVLWVT